VSEYYPMPEIISRSIDLPNGREAVIELLPGVMDWGEGVITSPEMNHAQLEELASNVVESLVEVPDDLLRKSGCTDGRGRVQMLDGSEAPVLQKLVGTDLITAFMMSEALMNRFYGDTLSDASYLERMEFLADYLKQNDIDIMTHEGCGARAGYPVVIENGVRFLGQDMPMIKRMRIFDSDVQDNDIQRIESEWSERSYEGWDSEAVRGLVLDKTGPSGIKVLHEDHSHPAHGHKEKLIARLDTPGIAFSARAFADKIQDSSFEELRDTQVFSVNDDRIERLAQILADNPEDYRIAKAAGLAGTDAGHATLSKDLPTLRIREVR
jgi:hypothetical protein